MAYGNAAAVLFGRPGIIRVAAIGATEPTDSVGAWSSDWYRMGYTNEGSAFNYNITTDNVDVAEELDVFARVTTGRDASVEFAAAEMTYRNLKLAFNGGLVTAGGTAWTFEPPDLGSETRVMLGWDSTEDYTTVSPVHTGTNPLRIVFRQCFQGGSLGIENRKGTVKQTISMNFQLEKPASGLKILKMMGSAVQNPVYT